MKAISSVGNLFRLIVRNVEEFNAFVAGTGPRPTWAGKPSWRPFAAPWPFRSLGEVFKENREAAPDFRTLEEFMAWYEKTYPEKVERARLAAEASTAAPSQESTEPAPKKAAEPTIVRSKSERPPSNPISRRRKIILGWMTITVIAGLVPPWITRSGNPSGYHVLFMNPSGYAHRVDTTRLYIEWMLTAVVAVALLIIGPKIEAE